MLYMFKKNLLTKSKAHHQLKDDMPPLVTRQSDKLTQRLPPKLKRIMMGMELLVQ